MELGSRWLSLLLVSAHLRQTIAQEVNPDIVDFSTVDDWDDLEICVQNRLVEIARDVGCTQNSRGESTNTCLCRPDLLTSAIQIIQEKAMEECHNIEDKIIAKFILVNYCKSKGFTALIITAVPPSTTGMYTVSRPLPPRSSSPLSLPETILLAAL